jgi:saccharopine dehydrogenase (NAD+, L-lysine forming)
LPSVLPRESSEDFSNQLLPHLIMLGKQDHNALPVWKGALDIFEKISKDY